MKANLCIASRCDPHIGWEVGYGVETSFYCLEHAAKCSRCAMRCVFWYVVGRSYPGETSYMNLLLTSVGKMEAVGPSPPPPRETFVNVSGYTEWRQRIILMITAMISKTGLGWKWDFMGKDSWVVKWREMKGLCESVSAVCVGESTRNYRVIHKSLRDFRTRLRNNQDRHGRKEHINR